MVLTILACLYALVVALSGNAARVVEIVASKNGVGLPLIVPAFLGQAAIAGLMLLAGAALSPALGSSLAAVAAAGALAAGVLLVLRPYSLIAPEEPTRSSVATGVVVAAFAVRDGSATLALAVGLLASHYTAPAAGLGIGAGVAMVLAMHGGASRFGTNARYLSAILMAAGALYLGIFRT